MSHYQSKGDRNEAQLKKGGRLAGAGYQRAGGQAAPLKGGGAGGPGPSGGAPPAQVAQQTFSPVPSPRGGAPGASGNRGWKRTNGPAGSTKGNSGVVPPAFPYQQSHGQAPIQTQPSTQLHPQPQQQLQPQHSQPTQQSQPPPPQHQQLQDAVARQRMVSSPQSQIIAASQSDHETQPPSSVPPPSPSPVVGPVPNKAPNVPSRAGLKVAVPTSPRSSEPPIPAPVAAASPELGRPSPFSFQFGSLSPGFMQIPAQIPARTSSAPPNLDEQKWEQARFELTRTVQANKVPTGLPAQQHVKQQSQHLGQGQQLGQLQLHLQAQHQSQQQGPQQVQGVIYNGVRSAEQPNESAAQLHQGPMGNSFILQQQAAQPINPVLVSSEAQLQYTQGQSHLPPQSHNSPRMQLSVQQPLHLQSEGLPVQMHGQMPGVQVSQLFPPQGIGQKGLVQQGIGQIKFPPQMLPPMIPGNPMGGQLSPQQLQPQLVHLSGQIPLGGQLPPNITGNHYGPPPYIQQRTSKAVRIVHPETHEELRFDGKGKKGEAYLGSATQGPPSPGMQGRVSGNGPPPSRSTVAPFPASRHHHQGMNYFAPYGPAQQPYYSAVGSKASVPPTGPTISSPTGRYGFPPAPVQGPYVGHPQPGSQVGPHNGLSLGLPSPAPSSEVLISQPPIMMVPVVPAQSTLPPVGVRLAPPDSAQSTQANAEYLVPLNVRPQIVVTIPESASSTPCISPVVAFQFGDIESASSPVVSGSAAELLVGHSLASTQVTTPAAERESSLSDEATATASGETVWRPTSGGRGSIGKAAGSTKPTSPAALSPKVETPTSSATSGGSYIQVDKVRVETVKPSGSKDLNRKYSKKEQRYQRQLQHQQQQAQQQQHQQIQEQQEASTAQMSEGLLRVVVADAKPIPPADATSGAGVFGAADKLAPNVVGPQTVSGSKLGLERTHSGVQASNLFSKGRNSQAEKVIPKVANLGEIEPAVPVGSLEQSIEAQQQVKTHIEDEAKELPGRDDVATGPVPMLEGSGGWAKLTARFPPSVQPTGKEVIVAQLHDSLSVALSNEGVDLSAKGLKLDKQEGDEPSIKSELDVSSISDMHLQDVIHGTDQIPLVSGVHNSSGENVLSKDMEDKTQEFEAGDTVSSGPLNLDSHVTEASAPIMPSAIVPAVSADTAASTEETGVQFSGSVSDSYREEEQLHRLVAREETTKIFSSAQESGTSPGEAEATLVPILAQSVLPTVLSKDLDDKIQLDATGAVSSGPSSVDSHVMEVSSPTVPAVSGGADVEVSVRSSGSSSDLHNEGKEQQHQLEVREETTVLVSSTQEADTFAGESEVSLVSTLSQSVESSEVPSCAESGSDVLRGDSGSAASASDKCLEASVQQSSTAGTQQGAGPGQVTVPELKQGSKKKKKKELLAKADAAGTTADLYNAYKAPEEKKTEEVKRTDINGVSGACSDSRIDSVPSLKKPVVKDLDDWEDAAELPTPKAGSVLVTSASNGASSTAEERKYTRDFLLTFKDLHRDIPPLFEFKPDIAEVLLNPHAFAAGFGDRDALPSPGRGVDRQPGAGPRLERRPSMGATGDDDRWVKQPGVVPPPGRGHPDGNIQVPAFWPGQGVSNAGLISRMPLGVRPGVSPSQMVGLIPGAGVLPHMIGAGTVRPNGVDSDRWQRAPPGQKGLIPSPRSHLPAIHRTENRYEVGKVSDEEEAKQRQIKGILNKLTPQNFEKLFAQVKDANIDSASTLTGVISQIFDKALMEPTFCEMYARFCVQLAAELLEFTEEGEKITFKRVLLNKCQEEFERGEQEQKEAESVAEEGEVKSVQDERNARRLKARRRMLGNIRFIGELYKKTMLTERIMHECIQKLLGEYQNPDEEDVEALCNLMSTIGRIIDHQKAKDHIDVYFSRMETLANNMKLSSRLRFMLKDVIDLRKAGWQERRKVEGPKRIDEVHRDAVQERQAALAQAGRRGSSVGTPRGRPAPPPEFSRSGSSHFGQQTGASSPVGGSRGSQGGPRSGFGQDVRIQDVRLEDRLLMEGRPLPMPLSAKVAEEGPLTLGPQGGLGRGIGGRSQSSNVSRSALVDGPGSLVTDRRHGGASLGFSATSAIDRGHFGRDDLPPRPSGLERSLSNLSDRPSLERQLGNRDVHSVDRTLADSPSGLTSSSNVFFGPLTSSSHPSPLAPTQLSEEELRKKSESTIKEFYSVRDMKEAAQCVDDLKSPTFLISSWVSDALDRKDVERTLLVTLLLYLWKADPQLVTTDQIVKGFEMVLGLLEDTRVDVPRAPEYLAAMLGKLLVANVLTLNQVAKLLKQEQESGDAIESHVVLNMFADVLGVVRTEKSETAMCDMYRASGLRIEDFLSPERISRGDEIEIMVEKKQLQCLYPMIPVERHIRDALQRDEPPTDILGWIEKNVQQSIQSQAGFLQAMMTQVLRHCIPSASSQYDKHKAKLRRYAPLLKKLAAGKAKAAETNQKHYIVAVQLFANELGHPPGLMPFLFDSFYRDEVISEAAYQKWQDDVSDPTPGRDKAIREVGRWLMALAQEEGGDEED